MAKIMIVEDDRNLLSIYGDRLKAEGHEVIVAGDGEEALAVAVKEKPELIISDVMMPKVSGFDMLDILRSTPETKDVKIIIMTALSQAEDRERANKLGADKYLVKTQVTLDDVARTVNEIVGGAATTPVAPQDDNMVATQQMPAPDSVVPISSDPSASAPSNGDAESIDEEQAKISAQIDDFLNKNMSDTPAPHTPQLTPDPVATIPEPSAATTPSSKPNIFELYEKELANEASQAEGTKESDAAPKL